MPVSSLKKIAINRNAIVIEIRIIFSVIIILAYNIISLGTSCRILCDIN
jgi:hypothetical protein